MPDRDEPTVLAWHFLSDSDKLRDGRAAPPNGEWLEHPGPLAMCAAGLHASERAIDALQYAPGSLLCRVECGGEIRRDTDKLVCSRRRILWRAPVEQELRTFARWCALDVAHLWDMPQTVRDYLEIGDESKRAAARDAAWAAAWDAAWAAAWDAKWKVYGDELERRMLALEVARA